MIGRWHDKKPSKALGIKADNVSAASVGKEKEPAPETRRSGESGVGVYVPTTSRWTRDYKPTTGEDPRCEAGTSAKESQSGQINSCRFRSL